MATQVNINDPKNYKSCRKKQYEIWVCKPPAGTVIINKLEQANVVRALNGVTFFSAVAIERFRETGNPIYQQLMQYAQQGFVYVVKEQDVVLSGTRGEMWLTSIEKVQRTYQVMSNGQWGSDWAGVTKTRGETSNGKFVLPWMKVRSMGDAAAATMACFVPASQAGQIQTSWAVLNYNAKGVEHGLGDFILCSKNADGSPDLSNRWVVNGAVFADTYNNQGWQGCIKPVESMLSAPEPAPLFTKAADAVAKLADLVKIFHEEFRHLGHSYKIESKRGQSSNGIDIMYRIRSGDNTPVTCTVLFTANDMDCKSVKLAFSAERWNITSDFGMNGQRPMLPVAKYVWGTLHEDCGLARAVEWTLSSVARSLDDAISHNLTSRGFHISQHGTGKSGAYATLGYAISGHGHSGIELRVRVGLTETNCAKANFICKYRDEHNDTSRFNIKDLQDEAEEIVTEGLIGAGFPFDM